MKEKMFVSKKKVVSLFLVICMVLISSISAFAHTEKGRVRPKITNPAGDNGVEMTERVLVEAGDSSIKISALDLRGMSSINVALWDDRGNCLKWCTNMPEGESVIYNIKSKDKLTDHYVYIKVSTYDKKPQKATMKIKSYNDN